jgi:outer membrane protein
MKNVLSLILASFVFVSFQATAFSAQAAKVGVVDLQEFQKQSKAYQKIRADIQKNVKAMEAKLEEENRSLMKLEDEFQKQSMMLNLDAQEDKRRELEKKRRYYKYLHEDLSQELKSIEVDTVKKIMGELEVIVKEIGEKEGYTLILEKRALGLIYYDKAIDITDRLIKAYDKVKQ